MSYCEIIRDSLPSWANDYLVVREWAPACWCGNVDHIKVVVPRFADVWRPRGLLLRDGDLVFRPGATTPVTPHTWGGIKGLFRA